MLGIYTPLSLEYFFLLDAHNSFSETAIKCNSLFCVSWIDFIVEQRCIAHNYNMRSAFSTANTTTLMSHVPSAHSRFCEFHELVAQQVPTVSWKSEQTAELTQSHKAKTATAHTHTHTKTSQSQSQSHKVGLLQRALCRWQRCDSHSGLHSPVPANLTVGQSANWSHTGALTTGSHRKNYHICHRCYLVLCYLTHQSLLCTVYVTITCS